MKHILTLLLAAAALSSCKLLGPDAPPAAGVTVAPEEVEAHLREAWAEYWRANMSGWGGLGWSTVADELTSTSSGYGRRLNSAEPRTGFDNDPNSTWSDFVDAPWRNSYRCLGRTQAVLRSTEDSAWLALSHFLAGLCLGTVAVRFERGFLEADLPVQHDGWAEEVIPPEAQPVGPSDIMAAALTHLDQAIGISESAPFELADDLVWGLPLTNRDMGRLANSFAARFMASGSRTPAARAAVDWSDVLSRIERGIADDFAPIGAPWPAEGGSGLLYWAHNGTSSRVDFRTIGPADESGGYSAWVAQQPDEKEPFLVATSDRRIHGDTGPTSPGLYFEFLGLEESGLFSFLRGRDHFATHVWTRRLYYFETEAGPMPHMLKAEMDLLAAEALLHTSGSTTRVAELINRTRVPNGKLPPATGADAVGTPTDGSWRNVGIHLPEASLWAKLQHEYRLETFATSGPLAWATDRGWGDLVEGTPSEYPIPGRVLAERGL